MASTSSSRSQKTAAKCGKPSSPATSRNTPPPFCLLLLIRLPQAFDISFIDAAHLVPFSESRNDHPTNGLALCKNHHWAMDRNLIAPCPDHHWRVSRVLDARRSNGERELLELAGRSLLLPRDEAFRPAEEFLTWRCKRLSA